MLEQTSKYLNSIGVFPFFISFFCWNEINKISSKKEDTRKMESCKADHILEWIAQVVITQEAPLDETRGLSN